MWPLELKKSNGKVLIPETCDTPGVDLKLLEGVRFSNIFYTACQNLKKKLLLCVELWTEEKNG